MKNKTILDHAINGLSDLKGSNLYASDLHHELFNRDYFIIGCYQAEQFLKECEDGIFGAIEIVKEYEQVNFGEVNTDFSSSENVANMYAYIKGEELLQQSKHLSKVWDKRLTDKDLNKIKKELENL